MTKVAIVFHSASGTTGLLAQAVAEGVESVTGVKAMPLEIFGKDIVEGRYQNSELITQLSSAQGVVFGSPTYMGSVSAQFKAFVDATGDLWAKQAWAGKVASGFTIGSNYSGDQLSTIQFLQVFASQHGMLWAGINLAGGYSPKGLNRLGAQSGLIAQSGDGELHQLDCDTAQYLGARVARLARLYKGEM